MDSIAVASACPQQDQDTPVCFYTPLREHLRPAESQSGESRQRGAQTAGAIPGCTWQWQENLFPFHSDAKKINSRIPRIPSRDFFFFFSFFFPFLQDAIMVLTEPRSALHGWIAVCCLGSNSWIPLAFKPAKSEIQLTAQPPWHITRACSPFSCLHPQSWPHAPAALGSQPGLIPSDFPRVFYKIPIL